MVAPKQPCINIIQQHTSIAKQKTGIIIASIINQQMQPNETS